MIRLAIFFFFTLWHNVEPVKVKVNEGWLEGVSRPLATCLGEVYSFQGIPYAEPPVGELRFKAPIPHKGWKGVRDAKHHGQKCIQFDVFTQQNVNGSEDCLFLNVYTPKITPKIPLPVMFFIHGGGWKSGSGNEDEYGPDFLVCHGVILVTINYRLDALGNLCMDTKEVPGNAGMKDQVLALKWVRSNIECFGGDPNEVTIIGESAGGAAVIYHMMSPMSKGLFKRAITMSGVQLSDCALPFYPRKRAFLLGKILGKNTNDPGELLKFLQGVPVESLINQTPHVLSQESLWGNNLLLMFPFVPVPEKDFGQDRFLVNTPIEILQERKIQDVNLLIGYTSKEHLLLIPMLENSSSSNPMSLEKFNMFTELMAPREILLQVNPRTVVPLAEKIHTQYFGDQFIGVNTLAELITHSDDHVFIYNINRFLKYLPIRRSKTYLYKFFLVSGRNRHLGGKYNITGCSHTDDLRYLFSDSSPVAVNTREYKLIDLTCSLFTNFAKYGDPTPDNSFGAKWLPYNKHSRNYMNIDDVITPGKNPDAEIVKWWSEISKENGVQLP